MKNYKSISFVMKIRSLLLNNPPPPPAAQKLHIDPDFNPDEILQSHVQLHNDVSVSHVSVMRRSSKVTAKTEVWQLDREKHLEEHHVLCANISRQCESR